ncbi:galectin-9B-like [Contarinia nasturtii]|uniref:galectin-9B-like n=1 Tax=Contarinia nasturtii TaxID=265458 RepID=UPI0012D4142C|nr:galectin-9B-like [Contarinia nasturtii]XP_031634699.1 galectin-9B-like [Contarinia nasturtii]
MATLPAFNPKIPYLGLIPSGLHHGLMIRINGEMLRHDRFNIDIKTGPIISPSDDINLHLSVRPNENAIVRNHFVQAWGPEERMGGCPIQYGERFEILILAEAEHFKIAVNGRHFAIFNHRIPLSSARFIFISGQVSIQSIKLEGDPNSVYNSVTPTAPILSTITSSTSAVQPPPYQQPYQPPPFQNFQPPSYQSYQPHSPYQPNPHASFSTTVNAVPSNQQTYPSGQYYGQYQTPHTIIQYHPTEAYRSGQPTQYYAPHQTYQTYTPTKSSTGSNALKVAAGIGGIGLGAYAISKIFDSDGSNSD